MPAKVENPKSNSARENNKKAMKRQCHVHSNKCVKHALPFQNILGNCFRISEIFLQMEMGIF